MNACGFKEQFVDDACYLAPDEIPIEIRNVSQYASLCGNGIDDFFSGMTERGHRKTREKVEILLPLTIDKDRSSPLDKCDRRLWIRVHDLALNHESTTIVPTPPSVKSSTNNA